MPAVLLIFLKRIWRYIQRSTMREFSRFPTCMYQKKKKKRSKINSHEIVLDVFQKASARYDRLLTWKYNLEVWFQNSIKACFNMRSFGSYKVFCCFSCLIWWQTTLYFVAAIFHVTWSFHTGVPQAAEGSLHHLSSSTSVAAFRAVLISTCSGETFFSPMKMPSS